MLRLTRTPGAARFSAAATLGRAAATVPARLLSRSTLAPGRTGTLQNRVLAFSLQNRNAVSQRLYSVLTQNDAKQYKYEDIKALTENAAASPETLLIDVREPVEFQEGHIPGAYNVPFKSSPGAFDLSEEEFEESFGFEKPAKDQNLVFYCLGGVRLTAAEELANSFGYTKRGNYVGSWEDWVTQENAKKA